MLSCVSFSTFPAQSAAHGENQLVLRFSQMKAIFTILIVSPDYGNCLPSIALSQSFPAIKLSPFFGHNFKLTLIPRSPAAIMFSVLIGPAPQIVSFLYSASKVTLGLCQY